MAVRAVIFDVGHVLYDWDPRYFYRRLIGDDRALDAFLGTVCTLDWHFQHDLGRPFAETSAELIAAHPAHADLIRAWGAHFIDQIGDPMPGMPAIITALHEAGVPLYALTNFSHEFWVPFRQREAWLFDRFSGFVVSGEEKIVKPDPTIFRLALDRFGLAADETLFVDDKPHNVAAAQALGIHAHLFTDAPALHAELRHHGLLAG
jgi:2-haloacid dehalogenase